MTAPGFCERCHAWLPDNRQVTAHPTRDECIATVGAFILDGVTAAPAPSVGDAKEPNTNEGGTT